jgi:NADP-dependent 3-hydroxy acid dehydrogenase YdfG
LSKLTGKIAVVTGGSSGIASGPRQSHAATKPLLRVWQRQGRSAARAALYDISMLLFDTADVQSALHNAVKAVSAGLPIPKGIFPNQKERKG